MAPYDNFATLLTDVKNELPDLRDEEYLRFGNHVYVLRKEIEITQLLDELAACGSQGSTSPILYLHLYCQRLKGTLTNENELRLQVNERGLALKSLHIFTVELPPLKSLLLVENPASRSSVRLSLYYDIESGPTSFYLKRSNSPLTTVHVLKGESICVDSRGLACTTSAHFDTTAIAMVGVRLIGSGPLEPIISVCLNELRPPRSFEYEAFGEHMARLQNLPRLLDQLFVSAGQELMGPEPDIRSITAKLRFIIQCAREAPSLIGLVNETQTLFNRLEAPKTLRIQSDDCFFVPEKGPRVLESVMDIPMNNLLSVSRKLESNKEMQELRSLIKQQGGALLEGIGYLVGSTTDRARLAEEARQATDTAETAMDKMDDLSKYQRELEDAMYRFDKGVKDYEARQRAKLFWDILGAVFQVGVSVGMALFTGGGKAAATVDDLNKILSGATEIGTKASKLWIAIKALGKALMKVSPKVYAAVKNHKSFTDVDGKDDERGKGLMGNLKSAAHSPSGKLLATQIGERLDYLGLIADWREMEKCTESAFDEIDKAIEGGKIEGMAEYRLAMKKLAIRGETLVTALKESYEARTRYLVRVAETRMKEDAMAEIKRLHDKVVKNQLPEGIAFMSIRYRLQMELSQRRRVVFNMLHQGILALIYQANDVKLQKKYFIDLSPGLTADQLADQWDSFKRATISIQQPQDKELKIATKDALPLGWRDLLVHDLETPFQIKPDLEELKYNHHMRIREISAEFVGLKRNGSSEGIENLGYIITLGPLMVDRASPYNKASSSRAQIVRYYMESQALEKSGQDNNLLDERGDFAKRAVCCSGTLGFRRETIDKGWDLSTITGINLTIKYETLIFTN